MKKLIVGLGNPGEKYEKTRHNVGFLSIDALSGELGATWDKDATAKLKVGETDIVLLKPQDFMNKSGDQVAKIANFYKIEPDDVWVIHDDADLAFGKVNVKKAGGDAGHNGIKSIDERIGNEYWRVRIGVGRGGYELADYVLSPFSDEEQAKLPEIIDETLHFLVKSIKSSLESISINVKEK